MYSSPVVTGDMNLAADFTPTGPYHTYAKETNRYLDGSDSTGSWHDYVNYRMPFLDTQYGTYGLHDATWRAPSDFGTVSPYSSNASHGCVDLPLTAAQWLYNWAPVGMNVVVQS
jgi:lipoprotein-anchoring transpeptidase ErfK/SrfK